ncbi:MAG TPA: phosphatase PAP2 family protein [Candidatus Cybelea sp.]|jgi:membrane-associated phospholipid phosphatase|nr:phosphatase PAP2 family protein [Candidatus Cybelea sp.]
MSRLLVVALCYAVALVAFGAFAEIGSSVIAHGEPALFVPWERSLFDHSTLLAWWLTWACYPGALIPICLIVLFLAWRYPQWRTRLILSVVSLLISWRGADYFQHVYARHRPLEWVVRHETTFSYPSSHAAIAVGFYGLLALMIFASDLPRTTRNVAGVLLVVLAAAICWSRVALGAHYITDLLGGALFGAVVACLMMGVLASGAFGGVGGRLSRTAE